jgi:hypothetical protein
MLAQFIRRLWKYSGNFVRRLVLFTTSVKYTDADAILISLGLNPANYSASVKARFLVALNSGVSSSDLTIGGVAIVNTLVVNPPTWGR